MEVRCNVALLLFLDTDVNSELEIIMHNVAQRTQIAKVPGAHKGKLSGICWADENRLLSSGVDKTVKMWDMRSSPEMSSPGAGPSEVCGAFININILAHPRSLSLWRYFREKRRSSM